MTCKEALETVSGMLSSKRLEHSINVSKSARELALRWGEDPDKAQIAGILHDICKELPREELLQWVHKSGIILSEQDNLSPQLWHAMAGQGYVREKLGIRDMDILSSIRWHTTGRAGMSRFEMIIYLADYISAERRFPLVDELRELAQTASLEEAVLFSLDVTIRKLLNAKSLICIDTVHCYNWLAINRNNINKEVGSR